MSHQISHMPSGRFMPIFIMAAIISPQASLAKSALKPVPELIATVISDHEVELSWQKYSIPVILEKRLFDQESFSQIGVFEPGQRRFVDRHLPVNTEIIYRLRPAASRYLDQYGTEKSVEIPLPAPSPPSLRRVGINSVQITIDNRSPWAKYVGVERRVSGTYSTIGRIANDTNFFVENDLETGSYLYYRIVCLGEQNDSPPSQPDSIFLDFFPPIRFGYQLINDHTLQLHWQNSMPFPCAFEIEKKSPQGVEMFTVHSPDTAWIDEEVPYKTYVYYRIRSKENINYSDYSYPLTVYSTLDPVQNLVADSIHDVVVHLKWLNSKDLATSYFIERSVNNGPFETLIRIDGKSDSYIDSLDGRGLTIRYRVASKSFEGECVYSNEVTEVVPDIYESMVYVASKDSTPGFYVDACEVTVEHYSRFCEETARILPEDPGFSTSPDYWRSSPNLPAVNVSWLDAIAFCNWRSSQIGLESAYDSRGDFIDDTDGFRLLTEELFRSALSQSGQTVGNFFGDSDGWWGLCGCVSDSIDPSKVQNLLGNVWEWAQDSYTNGSKIILGGSNTTPIDLVNGIPKYSYLPETKSPSIGFRCILPDLMARISQKP